MLARFLSMFFKKPKKHVIGHHIGPNKDHEFYYQSGAFVTATSDGKILGKVVIKEVVERAHEKYMKNLDEENAGMHRYRVHRTTADELLKQYKTLDAKIEEATKTAGARVYSNQFCQLVIRINDNIEKYSNMIKEISPDSTICIALKETMREDTKNLVELYNKIKNAPSIPLIQDFENKLNIYETALKNMPAPTTPCEASLLEDCLDWVKTFRKNLAVDKETLDIESKLRIKLIALMGTVKNRLCPQKEMSTKSPHNESNQHSNTNLYSSNQTYTPGCYQPAPSQDTGAIDLLTKQTATMNI